MPVNKIRAFANSDVVTIVWKTESPIKDCRGFALERATKGQSTTSFLLIWVGFKGGKHKDGESKPSTQWPIQRYIWSDFQARAGQNVRYRAIPMVGPAASLAKEPQAEWSDWTDWVSVGTGQTKGFEAYFNRGIIHSKVVVDPFGKEPVVMTGSHNLGPKASTKNDDNLVIIENAPGLASEYAVNMLGVYGHYKWLYNLSLKKTTDSKKAAKSSPQYDGNFDDDKWQEWYTKGVHLREIKFWLG